MPFTQVVIFIAVVARLACGQNRHAQHRWAQDGEAGRRHDGQEEELQHRLDAIEGEEVGSALRADEYGGDEDFSWVWMLEPAAVEPQSAGCDRGLRTSDVFVARGSKEQSACRFLQGLS